MKIAIVGSREFNDYELLSSTVNAFIKAQNILDKPVIISGGANGADKLAEQYAKENHFGLTIFPAEWDKYGKSAGYKRNVQIIDECDVCFAFWNGTSKGTKMDIDLCHQKHKPCFVIMYLDSQQKLFD